jgi:putative MFS transporter
MTAKTNPLAGKPAPPSLLVNVPRLVAAYYCNMPDPSIPSQRVSFGTSGHRGSASNFTFGMTLAVPCASLFMMYALDKIGRKKTSVGAFICAGIMAIAFANAQNDTQLLIAGFIMIFLYQVAGNSMQIFASEVFPTNARAPGFGMAAGIGRLATAFILAAILWIQTGYGTTTVFACIAVVLLIAAFSVTMLGPEARQLGLDEVAPPTA